MGFIAALPAMISVVGGMAGRAAQSNDMEHAFNTAQQAYDQIVAVGAPPDLAKQIVLDQFKQVGLMTPQLEQAINLGPSKVANIQEDPALRQAQMGALTQMQGMAKSGFSPQDYAALLQQTNSINSAAQAKQNQIIQDMQSRGLDARGSSGAELAARLAGAQGANNQQQQAGLDIAGQASQRALQAMSNAGQMSGQLRGQDFSNAMAKANAADAFRQFDVQNQLAQQTRNTAAQNAAQEYNLNNAQNIANMNTQQTNAERYRQAEAQRQYWQDQMSQATAKSNALLGKAGVYNAQAQNTGNAFNSVAGGLASGVGAYNDYNTYQDYMNRRYPQTYTTWTQQNSEVPSNQYYNGSDNVGDEGDN